VREHQGEFGGGGGGGGLGLYNARGKNLRACGGERARKRVNDGPSFNNTRGKLKKRLIRWGREGKGFEQEGTHWESDQKKKGAKNAGKKVGGRDFLLFG